MTRTQGTKQLHNDNDERVLKSVPRHKKAKTTEARRNPLRDDSDGEPVILASSTPQPPSSQRSEMRGGTHGQPKAAKHHPGSKNPALGVAQKGR